MIACRRLYQLPILCVVLSLMLTACFRDTSEVIEQQPVARQYATATTVEQEAEPTEAVPVATEAPIIEDEPADDFALSATALIAQLTQVASGQVTSPQVGAQETPEPGAQVPAATLVRATIPPGEDCVHEIRAGDTLFQLSLAYGVTVDQIAIASAIVNPDVIAVGERIIIPLCGTTGFIPPPTSIPLPTVDPATLPATSEPAELEIAAVSDTRTDLIEQAQSALLSNAQTGTDNEFSIQSADPPASGGTYTVQDGDTLFLIAVRHGTTVEVLAALNNITDINSVSAGDILQLP